MLKAIWPSLARLPNHLSPGANITTSGLLSFSTCLSHLSILTDQNIRDDVLSSVLDNSVSVLARITSENQVVIRGEG
jgi:hypothetical protein